MGNPVLEETLKLEPKFFYEMLFACLRISITKQETAFDFLKLNFKGIESQKFSLLKIALVFIWKLYVQTTSQFL